MAGFRERWPAGMSGEVKDLRDGTSIRGLSPHRGPLGMGPTSPDRSPQSVVERLLGRLRLASSGTELQRTLVDLLGPQCFSLGVLAGIGVDIVSSVVDLVKLIGKLALADLHDINTGHVHWSRYFEPTVAPRLITGRIAGAFFGPELREAAAERDALVQELSKAFADPQAFFETVNDQLIAHYQKEWQDFKNHMAVNSLEGRFRAGMIFGKLLLVVFGVATGVYGAARLTAKAASELPRLARYAQSFARRGTGSTGGSTGTAQTPSQLRKEVKNPSSSSTDDLASVKGAPRKFPYGFRDEAQYRQAMMELNEALKRSGIDDANIGVRGSAVSGRSSKGGQFRIDADPPLSPSDIDVFVESKKLTDGIKTSANIPGFAHPEKVMDKFPALREWSDRWSSILGREITPGGFRPGTVPADSPNMPFGG